MEEDKPQDDDFRRIGDFVRRRLGISLDRTTQSAISSAVVHRMRRCEIERTLEYLDRLNRDATELQHLIDEIVVPETWFFRDRLPYLWLREHARRRADARSTTSTLRILSVPCATGEEPYSIAMVLLDLGLSTSAFHVDGVDISRRAIDLANAAQYEERSFREPDFRDRQARWFDQSEGKYILAPAVRAAVSFGCGNVLEPEFLATQPPYDVIFCRNLLIYFDAPARQQALANLGRLLAPGGLLYVGHVEANAFADGPFRRAGGDNPFVFMSASGSSSAQVLSTKPSGKRDDHPRNRVATRRVMTKAPRKTISQERSPRPTNRPAPPREPVAICDPNDRERCSLRPAAAAADAGRLEEAQLLCEKMLRDCPTCAEAFYLLGVVHDALGKEHEAEKCFQKSVYLDPTHHASLVHLGLHAQRRGELDAAANFRRRANTLLKERKPDGR